MSAVITQTSALAQLANGPEAAGDLVLQAGAVVEARVLAVRDNLARIIISGIALEVLSEVALQPGAALKLAVSQTPEGPVRLAVVSPDTALRAGQVSAPALAASPAMAPASAAFGAVAPKLIASPPLVPPTPETLALSQAVQTAAPKQASLAPLFANLPVIVASDIVPRQVQSAASQLLATRPPLDDRLTASDLRQAFQKSGLFLESTLARGTAPQGSPDLKAALVVFRQVLTNWLGQTGSPAQFSASTAQPSGQGAPPQAQASLPAGAPVIQSPGLPAASAQTVATASTIVLRTQGPQPGSTNVAIPAQPQDPSVPPPVTVDRPAVQGEAVRQALQLSARDAINLLRASAERAASDPVARAAQTLQGQHAPAAKNAGDAPPPFRGAAPAPQPVASPTLAVDTPPASIGRQLLEQTDAALARQTLLQVASLPDRPDMAGANQSNQPRWSFEIPFATPQGTAMAQFEISRDGGNEVEAVSPSRVWRARFTLDVEPAGPVHALVSLVGEKTAVRMWAERPETAAQLRAGAGALGDALRQAELEPGDIVVGEGAPPQPVKMRAGRFLDRAT